MPLKVNVNRSHHELENGFSATFRRTIQLEMSGCLDDVFVSVILDCQCDRVLYHPGDTWLGMSLRLFVERLM